MSNRVYTYSKLDEIERTPYFREIAAIPQITMSIEVSWAMKKTIRVFKAIEGIDGKKEKVMCFSEFSERLFPDWNDSSQKFRYVTILNHFIRNRIEETADKLEREWLFGCKKNLYSAINNIIRLEEAGANPEDISKNDRDIRLFVEMWRHLRKEDGTIEAFHRRREELKDISVFEKAVAETGFRFHGKKAIVWHGFQFLTPMQNYVYNCFVRAGYDIYALIRDDVRYPYANEIWDYLYNKSNGFPNRNDWIRQSSNGGRNALGDIFETGEKTTADNIRIIKYANTVEFIEDIPRIKDEGYYIYCADDRTANSILRDYYPERYEDRNLLSYPIGQFIYTLHTMWDENLQCIVLNQDGLRKCFASGWLSAKSKSSANYTEDLERLLPYFEGCYTVDEWNERLDKLISAYEDAIDVFISEPSAAGTTDPKKELLGNPFRNFGVFSIKDERMDDVITIIGQLIKMARVLFGKNEPVSIQQHMSKLDAMLYMNDGMPRDLFLQERKTVKKIFAVLESDRVKDFMCYPGDLAAALISFMGDRLDDEDTNKQELKTLVFNVFQIDASPISAGGKVHICLADISKLPGAAGRFSWPLDEELLKDMLQNNTDTYIDNLLESSRLSALSNRYYTYSALQNPDVEISWVEKQGEKLFAPSPYITLLDKLTNSKIRESEVRKLDLEYVSKVWAHKRLEKKYSMRDNQELHVYDSELEYSLCPMRFVYSYVLSDNPSYRNEYQQNRAVVRLIQALKELLGDKYSLEQVASQVFELFPGIRRAEKRQMLDDAARLPLPEEERAYTEYEGWNYTNYRLNLKFPDEDSYSYAKRNAAMLMSQQGRKGIFHNRRGTDGERICELCPHSAYCMKALFGVDYKGDEV